MGIAARTDQKRTLLNNTARCVITRIRTAAYRTVRLRAWRPPLLRGFGRFCTVHFLQNCSSSRTSTSFTDCISRRFSTVTVCICTPILAFHGSSRHSDLISVYSFSHFTGKSISFLCWHLCICNSSFRSTFSFPLHLTYYHRFSALVLEISFILHWTCFLRPLMHFVILFTVPPFPLRVRRHRTVWR